MKNTYETPTAEKVTFRYQEQVAASGSCSNHWTNIGDSTCQDFELVKNFNQ